MALFAGGGEDGGADGRGLGAPGGTEGADDLAVDDGGAEVALGAVVGRLDIVAVQEHVQAVAVGTVALLEACGLGLGGDVAVEHQPIGGVLAEQAATREGLRGDLRALTVQADCAAEVNGDDPSTLNSFSRPDAVVVQERQLSVSGAALEVTLPAHSVTVLRVSL